MNTATTEIYTLSLHDALPISGAHESPPPREEEHHVGRRPRECFVQQHDDHHHRCPGQHACLVEIGKHTSELQSQSNLVCRLLLENKKLDNNAVTQIKASNRKN